MDVKFAPVMEEKETISRFETSEELFQISPDMIKQYVEENTTDLSVEELMEGYERLKQDATKKTGD